MPCRPSAPPVHCGRALATSCSTSATASVTISRVRSLPRSTSRLVSEAQHRRDDDGDRQAGVRIGRHQLAEDAGGIGARAEEGGMAQRDDAGIAQDQIEREREQGEDRDLVQQQVLARRQRTARRRPAARRRSRPAPAGAPREACLGAHLAPREQAVRPQHQHDDQHDVDDEAAQRRGEVVFAGDVGDAEQQRGEERSHDPRRAADRRPRSGSRS